MTTLDTWIYLLKNKTKVRPLIQAFCGLVKNQCQTTVKNIRTNNGKEFKFDQFYATRGIVHQTSRVETPQQNSIVERKHQHILNVARALLFQANLPKIFWSYAVTHSVYLK